MTHVPISAADGWYRSRHILRTPCARVLSAVPFHATPRRAVLRRTRVLLHRAVPYRIPHHAMPRCARRLWLTDSAGRPTGSSADATLQASATGRPSHQYAYRYRTAGVAPGRK